MKLGVAFFASILISMMTTPLMADDLDIQFAGTDWCPYTCADEKNPGFITEYAKYLFGNIERDLSVTLLPWNRAMAKAKNGDFDGLITASALEAEGLNRTTNTALEYQMCFYVLPDSQWQYDGIHSLDNITLGAIQGYSYGEPVDEFLSEERPNTLLLSGNEIHKRLEGMLKLKRINALISDKLVLKYKIGDKLKEAGCLEPSPLFFAFNKQQNIELINDIDAEIIKKDNHTHLQKIMAKYILTQ